MGSSRNSRRNRKKRAKAAARAKEQAMHVVDQASNDAERVMEMQAHAGPSGEEDRAETMPKDNTLDEANISANARSRFTLVITLRSDLCAASGDGFSSGLDTDVCYDNRGVPYIPGRRIKGCLREAAELLCENNTEEGKVVAAIFGEHGSSEGGLIVVGPATIRELGGEALDIPSSMDRQKVIDLFTYTRAQTALEPNEGYAKKNSLRYMRVVKHYDPLHSDANTAKPLVFVADVEIGDCAVETGSRHKQLLERASHAMRNIGLDRNRGFGAVSCELKPHNNDNGDRDNDDNLVPNNAKRLYYSVFLDTPLMLPQANGTEGLEYVPGTSVLGFFASRLKDDPLFDELFLKDKVKFSPLYPVDNAHNRCKPAPSFVVKVKGGLKNGEYCVSAYYNSSVPEIKTLYRSSGASAKPLKSGFVDGNWHPLETRTEVVYHHSTEKAEMGQQSTLYVQRCISAGQEFAGYIDVDSHELYEKLSSVLKERRLSFGRSKTAQYARCTLGACHEARPVPDVQVTSGRRYAFLLDSDVILCGVSTPAYKPLEEALLDALGDKKSIFKVSDVEECASQSSSSMWFGKLSRPSSNISYRLITGYNVKWNQKKPHVRAISAGSAIVFTAVETTTVAGEFFVGERLAEGFGRVLLVDLHTISNPIKEVAVAVDESQEQKSRQTKKSSILEKRINDEEQRETLRLRAIEFAKGKSGVFCKTRFNQAFVGRLALMVEEASSRTDFMNRVNSIKMQAKQDETKLLLTEFERHMGWLQTNNNAKQRNDVNWAIEQECLTLMFTLGKYFAKERTSLEAKGGNDDA